MKVHVKYGGICGSDVNLLRLNDSPVISAYTSFPFTIGHETIGTVVETGTKITAVQPGERVVIEPLLSCVSRGFSSLCSQCQNGQPQLCERRTEGEISAGLLTGACRDTGGSWGSTVVAHESQLYPLPPEINDENALMVEPFSCALHAVLNTAHTPGKTVLVIGGGVIGICTIAAIRTLYPQTPIAALVKHKYQADYAVKYGANDVILLAKDGDYVSRLCRIFDAKARQPLFGSAAIEGGADLVYECVGSRRSIEDALRFAKSGGTVVLLGLAGSLPRIDWTTVWLNELNVRGSFAYGVDSYQGKKQKTFAIALNLLRQGKLDLSPMVTHRFPLYQYRNAINCAFHKSPNKAMKIVFEHEEPNVSKEISAV